ncbi:hypothetical protein EW146_g9747 [Bondarzewia mesenterica]|uniref:Uncharacterized protein n=1 Tax=Bondarzewia mesenterica TaxID=1095465 RepID=A0A4S4L3U9_9AGAM|nr:hypothetical protein EW146_g9747 [Bondarzewia mesenterica]
MPATELEKMTLTPSQKRTRPRKSAPTGTDVDPETGPSGSGSVDSKATSRKKRRRQEEEEADSESTTVTPRSRKRKARKSRVVESEPPETEAAGETAVEATVEPTAGDNSESEEETFSDFEFQEDNLTIKWPTQESREARAEERTKLRSKVRAEAWKTDPSWPKSFFDKQKEPFKYMVEKGISFVKSHKHVILVAACYDTGQGLHPLRMQAGNWALETLGFKKAASSIELGSPGEWSLIACESQAEVKAVLEMGAVVHNYHRMLFFFRGVRSKPYSTRVLTVSKGVTEAAVPIIREFFVKREEVKEVMGSTWDFTHEGTKTSEIFVKVKLHKNKPLEMPNFVEVALNKGSSSMVRFPVKDSPHCKLCRSNDHQETGCPWNKVELGFKLNRSWASKKARKPQTAEAQSAPGTEQTPGASTSATAPPPSSMPPPPPRKLSPPPPPRKK